MASSYTTDLRLELMATGEKSGTWGTVANTGVFQLIEDALTLTHTESTTGGNSTLTSNNGSTDESRAARIVVSGTLTSDAAILLPSGASKFYVVQNDTTGDYMTTIGVSGQTLVTVFQGTSVVVYCDGTDTVVQGVDSSGCNTGDLKWAARSSVPSGFLALNGETIGNASSGATNANNELEDLFTHLWAEFADAQAAVSTGRGGSAASDWAANKTLTMPDATGRTLFMEEASATRLTTGEGGVDGGVLGDAGGDESSTITADDIAHDHPMAHTHTFTTSTYDAGDADADSGGDDALVTGVDHNHTGTTDGVSTPDTGAVQNFSSAGIPVLNPAIIMGLFIKK